MWVLKYTGQFKKDLKRYQNKPKKIESLMRERSMDSAFFWVMFSSYLTMP